MDQLLKDWDSRTIGVVGLGYVGLPLAVEFGKKRRVIGFDINSKRIEDLRRGFDHTLECEPEELTDAIHLIYTDDVDRLREAEIFIVTVPTPIDRHKRPDLGPLLRATETVAKALKSGDCVIYESTVYPGCTEEDCVPVLEKYSGLTFNQDFFCGYSPERINPGDKAHRLPSIMKVTSGSTPAVAYAVDKLYCEIIEAGTHRASSMKVAEAAKVIENAQRDINIAFVNELSMIFNTMGIDTREVLEAANTKWNFLPFKPGLVGGHCIGVDPYYLTHKAQSLGYQSEVILSGRRINDSMGRYAAREFIRLMAKNKIDLKSATVGILGITFKENCPDVRNTRVIDLIDELREWGIGFIVSDPWADPDEVQAEFGFELQKITHDNPLDSLILAVAHTEYLELKLEYLRGLCAPEIKPVFADLKALYRRDLLVEFGFTPFRL